MYYPDENKPRKQNLVDNTKNKPKTKRFPSALDKTMRIDT